MTSPPEGSPPPGMLLVRDVARIWTEEARKRRPDRAPIRDSTVWSYVKESYTPNGRYRDHPVPKPQRLGEKIMWWPAEQEPELRQWWRDRPGHGHGRGGPRRERDG